MSRPWKVLAFRTVGRRPPGSPYDALGEEPVKKSTVCGFACPLVSRASLRFVSQPRWSIGRCVRAAAHGTNLLHLHQSLLTMSPDSVSACVASLCSAFHDGNELIQRIKGNNNKSRKFFQDPSAQELESSLNLGESAVRSHYEHTYKRCGEAFAQGDRMFQDHKYQTLR